VKLLHTIRTFLRQGDMVLLVLCSFATLFGIVLIASATQYRGSERFVTVQVLALIIGIGLYVFFSFFDLEVATEKWRWLPVFNVLFIASLLFLGVEGDTGNKSWIRFSWFPIGIQPAELVKLTFVLLLAKQITTLQEGGISRTSAILQLSGHTFFMCALIMAVSRDAGMVVVYFFIFLVMAFTAGVKLRWFVGAFAAAGGLITLFWEIFSDKLPDYIKMRFLVVLDHNLDPLDKGWQQTRSLLAIGSGRTWGQGLFQGTQTQSLYESSLPARHTDFIFSVAGEELGLVGCVCILLLLTAIIVRCIYVGLTARSSLSALVCMGFAGMLFCQTTLNIAMCLFIAPVIGLTLPFFSYGGSSIVTLFAAMGMVSGVKMRSLPSWLKDRRDIVPKPETE